MSKRDKNVAGILALFLGWLGVHRYYLGQRDRGLFYTIGSGIMMWGGRLPVIGWAMKFFWVPFVLLVSMVDAISLFAMDDKEFDEKYNNIPRQTTTKNREEARQQYQPNGEAHRKRTQYQSPQPEKRQPANNEVYKKSGMEKFADFDYEGAIEDFKKALEASPYDVASHFNLACAYSLTEKTDLSMHHLDRAVAFGFKDFDKIKTHHALAYLRIQPGFPAFSNNGFRLPKQAPAAASTPPTAQAHDLLDTQPDLLDQLKKLGDLRQKGLLTEQEFEQQKKRLLA